jgi:hypothetical protein
MVVNAGGSYIRVAEPLLHLGYVGLVVERVGGGGRAQRMRADFETEQRRVLAPLGIRSYLLMSRSSPSSAQP